MNGRSDDSAPTRQSLLMRLKQWDDSAGWRDFFDTYWELVYNVARRAGLSDSEAQDAVQETIIGVAKKIGEFDISPGRGSFKSWLLGQATWRIKDKFRARKRDARTFSATPDTIDVSTENPPDQCGDQFESLWDQEWEQHLMRTAMERVKAKVGVKQFQIFDLHVQNGLSVAETAHALGTTRAAVYMAKSRVGRLIRQEIQKLKM